MNTYKKSHTTSTKCQYQAAASKPTWWKEEKWQLKSRIKQINKNEVPIITCKPWNPVATKKVDPKTESAIVNEASIYSNACSKVKYNPKIIVRPNLWIAWVWFDSIIAWWAQVTVAPEERRMVVFKRGIWNGLKGWIPKGGQYIPISILGDNLLWKKAQKKEKKNNTSDKMKKIIPQRSPVTTTEVWRPWYVPSRVTSRHHWIIVNKIASPLRSKRFILYWWNHLINPVVSIIALIEPVKGQGLISTKW